MLGSPRHAVFLFVMQRVSQFGFRSSTKPMDGCAARNLRGGRF
jgi:hypothetical protein